MGWAGGRRRVLVLAVLAIAVLAGSAAATEAGLGSGGPGHSQAIAQAATSTHSAALCHVSPGKGGRPASGGQRPLLVVLGASFTAGVGAPVPEDGWAVRLAEILRWRAVTLGVPGAGYTAAGLDHLGPLASEMRRVNLPALHPSIVIIQAGHDDGGVPAAVETSHVEEVVRRLMAEAPGARLVLLTVFSRPGASAAVLKGERAVDSAIVSAVRRTDSRAIVIDPLREHWQFPRAADGHGLHPTAQGHLIIAQRVARDLRAAGAITATASRPSSASVSCTRLGTDHHRFHSAIRQV
jgi:acyl-CoA thioesterase I